MDTEQRTIRVVLTILSLGMLVFGISLLALTGSSRTVAITQGTARACPDMVSLHDGYGPDGFIDGSDVSAFAVAKDTNNALGDFTGDGFVNDIDQSILAALLGFQNIQCQNPDFWWPIYPKPMCPIETPPACPDMNGDRAVDGSDSSAFAAALEHQTPNGDFNGDGFVNALDQVILSGRLGATNFFCTACNAESNSNINGNVNGNINASGSINSNTNQSFVTVPPRQNIVTSPLLTIDKTVNQTTVAPGQELIYSVTLKNSGSASAEHVVLTDVLPSGFHFADTPNKQQVWNIADFFAVGSSTTVTYKVRVDANATAGDYVNIASVRADTLNPVIDTATVNVEVPIVLGATTETPVLTLKKQASRTIANPGDRMTYTLTVANTGVAEATQVVLSDQLPSGMLYLDIAGYTRSWNLGTIPAGTSASRSYEALVGESVKPGALTNIAHVLADGVPEISAKATVAVREGRVLGAETLAATGSDLRDILLIFIGGALSALGLLGLVLSRRLAP